MIQRLAFLFFAVALVVGGLGVSIGLVAFSRRDPGSVAWGDAIFLVKQRDIGRVRILDFVRHSDGTVAETIAGSTDLVCEPPHLILTNLDEDDDLEVYFTTCDESGIIDYRGRENLAVIELSESQTAELKGLHTFWFRQLRNGGWRLFWLGACCITIGIVGLGPIGLVLRRMRKAE